MLGTEIERKYLLKKLPNKCEGAPSVLIKDYYFNKYTRVREQIDINGKKYEVGIKGDGTLCRSETTISTTDKFDFKHTLNKRRYKILDPDTQLTWEVNEFLDKDLILAEVELKDEKQEVIIPSWLENAEEVTPMDMYYGYNLFREVVTKAITNDLKETLAKDYIVEGEVIDFDDNDKPHTLGVFPILEPLKSFHGDNIEALGRVFDTKTHKIMWATASCNGKVFSLSEFAQLKNYYLKPFCNKE